MRISDCIHPCRTRLTGLLILLFATQYVLSTPVQSDSEAMEINNKTLLERGCDGHRCGYYDQLCCAWNEGCYTNYATQAVCTPKPSPGPEPHAGGHWVTYTKTYVETDKVTYTRIIRSYVPPRTIYHPPQTTQKEAHCRGEYHPCGPICCRAWQVCIVAGQCGHHHRTPYTPPVRPTSYVSSIRTITVGHRTTTTVPFSPGRTHHHHHPGVTISESSTSTGLSAGAIAGIVIGVIVGIILLILLCMILCFKTAWDAFLAFFGIGERRRRRETVEYEHYSRHGSRSENRRVHGPPNGSAPSRREEKRRGFPGWATVVAGLVALWAALGFQRRRNRERRDEKSAYTASSGYYSDYSSSSDRRTRDTRRSSRR